MDKRTKTNSYRYYISPTSQFYFCGIPFRLDTTPKCDLNCQYCFAMARGGRATESNQYADIKNLQNKLEKIKKLQQNQLSATNQFLFNNTPIHFGGMSDPFSNAEATKISKEILIILANENYPIVISTKNTKALLSKSIVELLRSVKNLIVQVSFSVFNDNLSRLIEPNAVSPSKRLESIKRLAEMNINVMARLQPLFPIFLKEIENELIESLSENGCKHIITEFLKLPIEKNISNFKKLSELINWDIFEYFQNANAKKIGREWVLPAELIYSLSKPITRKIHELNMTHGFGDYGLNHLSDSSCCCGLDLFKGFENWFKGNFTYAIKSANQKKLKFDIIAKQYIPDGSIRELINSDSRNENSRIIEYLRDKWNSPGTINAPDSFLGVKCLNFKDKNGNFVYEKETERWT